MKAGLCNRIISLCFIVFAAVSAFAAEDDIPMPGDSIEVEKSSEAKAFTFSGYVENTTTAEYLKSESREFILNGSRARLKFSGRPSEHFDYSINLTGTLYSGANETELKRYLPKEERDSVKEPSPFVYSMENDIYLQEAFGTLYLGVFMIRAGRQKFYTGTGYAFNPIDLFNVKNPLDPAYETDGFDSMLAELRVSDSVVLQGLVKYSDRLSDSGYLARIKGRLSGWEIALQYTHLIRNRTDYITMNQQGPALLTANIFDPSLFVHEYRWHLAALEFSGEVFGWQVYGEGGYAFIKDMDDEKGLSGEVKSHERILAGINYTFKSELYVMAEYLRIGERDTTCGDYSLNDWLAYYSGEIESLNRDTIFAGVSYPAADLMDFSFYCISGINDRSFLLNPWIEYSVCSGCSLSVAVYIPAGKEGQNGESGASGFVRLKYSF